MLSKAKMVARQFLEETYDCKCDVIENRKVQNENKSTSFKDVKIIENEPCKISYERISIINTTDNSATTPLSIKMFISPDVSIKTGSKIIVSDKNNVKTKYKSSGYPAKYDTHQEIMLELLEGRS